jgi:hypothetical protein
MRLRSAALPPRICPTGIDPSRLPRAAFIRSPQNALQRGLTAGERRIGIVKSRRNAGVFEEHSGSRCRYCGASFAGPREAPACPRCEQIRERHEAAEPRWIGDDKLYLRVQRTLANRERTAAAERLAKHGPGRLERDGPAVKVSEAVAKAKRTARSAARQRSNARGVAFAEAAE